MIRRLVCIVAAVAVFGLAAGCDKGPVSTNTDNIPVKTSEGGKKTKGKVVEAGLEDPNYKK